MTGPFPAVVVLGGPNGAGKSTAAPRLLRGSLKVDAFVNADTLAQGLYGSRGLSVAPDGRPSLSPVAERVRVGGHDVPAGGVQRRFHRGRENFFDDRVAIGHALRQAARDARRFHKAMGNPMATLVDGEVVWVQPEDVRVDDELPAPEPPQ